VRTHDTQVQRRSKENFSLSSAQTGGTQVHRRSKKILSGISTSVWHLHFAGEDPWH
ncbi:hypothetical protein HAX54_023524, partial [Datura stramonium]|nr:hypothetical protein [Datura stramonium]